MSILRAAPRSHRLVRAALALACALAVHGTANAQFFPMSLPSEDFVWTWGRRIPELDDRRFEDIDIDGNEGGFRCSLTVKLSPSSNMTLQQIRELENDLRTSLFFVQAVANAMYYLDQSLTLDWAVLDCDKAGDEEVDETTREDREDKARERAERARERRRAREE